MKSEIKVGSGYQGKDGEIRYPILLSHVGRGRTVSWDSIPPGPDYYGDLYAEQRTRPHGLMALKDFERWAISEIEPTKEPTQ